MLAGLLCSVGSEGCASSRQALRAAVGVLGCARGPASHQRSLSWAASAPFPEAAWSGLDLGALTLEHSASRRNGASCLPLSDRIWEEGSWGPGWLAGRGAIPLLWGAECKTCP